MQLQPQVQADVSSRQNPGSYSHCRGGTIKLAVKWQAVHGRDVMSWWVLWWYVCAALCPTSNSTEALIVKSLGPSPSIPTNWCHVHTANLLVSSLRARGSPSGRIHFLPALHNTAPCTATVSSCGGAPAGSCLNLLLLLLQLLLLPAVAAAGVPQCHCPRRVCW